MILSEEHGRLRLRYLQRLLKRLPEGNIVAHVSHGKKYKRVHIRSYPNHPEYTGRYFSANRLPGIELAKQVEQYESVSNEIKDIRKQLIRLSREERVRSDLKRRGEPVHLNREYYDELKKTEDSNTYPKPQNAIEHNGILMRSRGEKIIAQHLDKLQLEYCYEPSVRLKTGFSPDFAVYIPEIDKVFFIEFMGALSDRDYLYKAGEKFKTCAHNDLIVGRDVLFICETDNEAADMDLLDAMINALITANTEPADN